MGSPDYVLVKAPSGKGKTTLLAILFGLRKDYRGQVWFNSADIRSFGHQTWAHLRRERLSCVFQDLQLFDDLTARQNIELKNDLTACKSAKEIDDFFERVGLGGQRNERVGQLSLGQKQRVALLRALCQPFECLLLDEPFSHLDPANAAHAAALIRQECERQGAGLVITSVAQEPEIPCRTVLNL